MWKGLTQLHFFKNYSDTAKNSLENLLKNHFRSFYFSHVRFRFYPSPWHFGEIWYRKHPSTSMWNCGEHGLFNFLCFPALEKIMSCFIAHVRPTLPMWIYVCSSRQPLRVWPWLTSVFADWIHNMALFLLRLFPVVYEHMVTGPLALNQLCNDIMLTL